MKVILDPSHAGVLDELARSATLLAFDFDGTLAPIVARRDDARMRASTARLFRLLCERYPVAVVSGRSRADVAGRLGDAPVRFVVGNHGIEVEGGGEAPGPGMGDVKRALVRALATFDGVDLEDKVHTLSVHTRNASDDGAVRGAIRDALTAFGGRFRWADGKCVVNVVPEGADDKGRAVEKLRKRAGATRTLYVGDDVTDEDVFRTASDGALVGVRVGLSPTSAAAYGVRSQTDVDRLLTMLCERRAGSVHG
ncbi:MAG: trehalose-phosphatase [Polyangiaceae bacterium]